MTLRDDVTDILASYNEFYDPDIHASIGVTVNGQKNRLAGGLFDTRLVAEATRAPVDLSPIARALILLADAIDAL